MRTERAPRRRAPSLGRVPRPLQVDPQAHASRMSMERRGSFSSSAALSTSKYAGLIGLPHAGDRDAGVPRTIPRSGREGRSEERPSRSAAKLVSADFSRLDESRSARARAGSSDRLPLAAGFGRVRRLVQWRLKHWPERRVTASSARYVEADGNPSNPCRGVERLGGGALSARILVSECDPTCDPLGPRASW